nr:transcription regulator [Tanacetum cinerariifolium]
MNNEPPQTLPSFDPTCYSENENSLPCVSKPNFVDESPNSFNPPPQPPIYSCEFCGSNAQYGHYCTPQVPFIYPEPGYNQDFDFPKFNRYSFFETPKVLLLAWDRVFEINVAFGNKQYKPEDIQELFRKLLNDVQNIHEELAECINTPSWNRPAFYNNGDDDDVNYTIAITPVLSTEEPDNSLSMGDEHLDTIPATKSDEIIKSSVEDLVPILSEFEGIPDTMCDVHLVHNSTPLEAKDHFEIVINSNDDYLSTLKDYPTPSSEFLTKSSFTSPKSFLEETNTFDNSLPEFENFCFDLEEISSGSTTTHSDISLLDYEAFYFYDDRIEEISSGSTTTHYDISLSEYDSCIFDLSNDQFPPTDRSDFTHEEFVDELAHIISPPEYDCFYFRNLPDPGEWISILNSEICENLSSTTRVNLPVEDDHFPLLALLHLSGSQPMLKSSYKVEASVIISIPPLVGGVADVVVEIKGTANYMKPNLSTSGKVATALTNDTVNILKPPQGVVSSSSALANSPDFVCPCSVLDLDW